MIVIEHLAGFATIQDLGRPGRMHEGLAPGGALVPELLIETNRRAGNVDHAPALELTGRLRIRCETAGTVFWNDLAWQGEPGAEHQIESGRLRVVYLALRGGIAAPLVCGGRGTQLSAGIGAASRAGDRLVPGEHATATPGRPTRLIGSAYPFRVIAGPESIPGALEALMLADHRISPASNRVGTRLDGPALPTAPGTGSSRPMVRGAIELPPDGHPIVLGPEHPTTGGYPVIGVIATADQGWFFAQPIGARVRFHTGIPRPVRPLAT